MASPIFPDPIIASLKSVHNVIFFTPYLTGIATATFLICRGLNIQ
jgi:hypothetical protein